MGPLIEFERQERVVRASCVCPERSARPEPELCIERPCGHELAGGSRLQADPVVARMSGEGEHVLHQRPSDASPPFGLTRVHRLQLGMAPIELLQRGDSDDLSASTRAEKSDRAIVEFINVQSEGVLGRRHCSREGQVRGQQFLNVLRPRIVDREFKLHAERFCRISPPPHYLGCDCCRSCGPPGRGHIPNAFVFQVPRPADAPAGRESRARMSAWLTETCFPSRSSSTPPRLGPCTWRSSPRSMCCLREKHESDAPLLSEFSS